MKKLRIAVIGQGRSGRLIHGYYYKSEANQYYDVAYIVERDQRAREIALTEYPGCSVFADYTELFGKTDIDLVVNASYSREHYPVTLDLLNHGFNVLVEKPFAENRLACETMIQAAKKNNVLLAVFQQSNLVPCFLFAKDLMTNGKIGEIKHISIRYNSFHRRWDWQTLQKNMAGSLYNTGPHPLAMGMSLLDFDPDMRLEFSRLDRILASGDAEDYAKLILTAPNRPVVDIEINPADAFGGDMLRLCGTLGTCRCNNASYEMKYMVPGENPDRPVIFETLRNEDWVPQYCAEKLITHTETGDFRGTGFDIAPVRFYENLYKTIMGEESLYFPPEQVARLVGFIEQAHAENPLPLQY